MKKRYGFTMAFMAAATVALASCASGDDIVAGSGPYQVATPVTTTALVTTPTLPSKRPATTPTSSPKPITTTTVPTTAAVQPTLAPGIVPIFGAKFTLDPNIWEVFADPKSPTARVFVVRKATCYGDDHRFCPGFAVVNQSGFATLLPYDPSEKKGSTTCRQDDFHNGGLGAYGPRVKVGTTSVNGRPTDHMMQPPCGGNSGTAVHSWLVGDLAVFDTDLDSAEALPELIARGGILSSVR